MNAHPQPLIVIRHGQTDWNRDERLQGQRDIPLNGLGRAQARRNGQALKALLDIHRWHWVASPLIRARQTLEIVRSQAGLPVSDYRTDERLLELSFGRLEGMTMQEVAEHDGSAIAERKRDKWGYVHPDGESYALLAGRVSEWLETVSEPTIVGAHGGTVRVLLHLIAGFPTAEVPLVSVPQDRLALFTDGKVEYM